MIPSENYNLETKPEFSQPRKSFVSFVVTRNPRISQMKNFTFIQSLNPDLQKKLINGT